MRVWKANSAYKFREVSLSGRVAEELKGDPVEPEPGRSRVHGVTPSPKYCTSFQIDLLNKNVEPIFVLQRRVGVKVLDFVYTSCIFIHLIIFHFAVKGAPQNMTICHT